MNYDPQKYLESRDPVEIALEIDFACDECGGMENLCPNCLKNGESGCSNHKLNCDKHNAHKDILNLKVKGLPFSRQQQITSQCLAWDDKGNTHFDNDLYFRECIKYMISDAPWGRTDDIFLSQIGIEFGQALRSIVPKAFEEHPKRFKGKAKKD